MIIYIYFMFIQKHRGVYFRNKQKHLSVSCSKTLEFRVFVKIQTRVNPMMHGPNTYSNTKRTGIDSVVICLGPRRFRGKGIRINFL